MKKSRPQFGPAFFTVRRTPGTPCAGQLGHCPAPAPGTGTAAAAAEDAAEDAADVLYEDAAEDAADDALEDAAEVATYPACPACPADPAEGALEARSGSARGPGLPDEATLVAADDELAEEENTWMGESPDTSISSAGARLRFRDDGEDSTSTSAFVAKRPKYEEASAAFEKALC